MRTTMALLMTVTSVLAAGSLASAQEIRPATARNGEPTIAIAVAIARNGGQAVAQAVAEDGPARAEAVAENGGQSTATSINRRTPPPAPQRRVITLTPQQARLLLNYLRAKQRQAAATPVSTVIRPRPVSTCHGHSCGTVRGK